MKRLYTYSFSICLKHNQELSTWINRSFPAINKLVDKHFHSNFDICRSNKARTLSFNHGPYSTDAKAENLPKLELSTSPERFRDLLVNENISRCFLINLDGKLQPSHPVLEEIVGELQQGCVGYDNHEAIFFGRGARTNCLLSVFVWRSNRGQGAGGVDLRPIRSMGELLRDGNTMSKNLGIKQALAGLWAGGGKCIITALSGNEHLDPEFRHKIFQDAGEFLTSLNGCMVAGTGNGSYITDMDSMFTKTKYVSNISAEYGGTGPVAQSTGYGVVRAMEAAIDHLDMGTWSGKVVVIQGGGDVGVSIVDQLLQKGAGHIHIAECNSLRAEDIKQMFDRKADGKLTVHKVSFEDTSIFSIPCDIFSPCAGSNVLDSTTIPLLDTKIICGASNSPVVDKESRQLLVDKKVIYISDVVPNRMGMVKKLLEPYGRINQDEEINKQLSQDWEYSIYNTTLRILQLAEEEGIDTTDAAYILGEKLSRLDHPLYPRRVHSILNGLVQSGWHQGRDFWKEKDSLFMSPDVF